MMKTKFTKVENIVVIQINTDFEFVFKKFDVIFWIFHWNFNVRFNSFSSFFGRALYNNISFLSQCVAYQTHIILAIMIHYIGMKTANNIQINNSC